MNVIGNDGLIIFEIPTEKVGQGSPIKYLHSNLCRNPRGENTADYIELMISNEEVKDVISALEDDGRNVSEEQLFDYREGNEDKIKNKVEKVCKKVRSNGKKELVFHKKPLSDSELEVTLKKVNWNKFDRDHPYPGRFIAIPLSECDIEAGNYYWSATHNEIIKILRHLLYYFDLGELSEGNSFDKVKNEIGF